MIATPGDFEDPSSGRFGELLEFTADLVDGHTIAGRWWNGNLQLFRIGVFGGTRVSSIVVELNKSMFCTAIDVLHSKSILFSVCMITRRRIHVLFRNMLLFSLSYFILPNADPRDLSLTVFSRVGFNFTLFALRL